MFIDLTKNINISSMISNHVNIINMENNLKQTTAQRRRAISINLFIM